MIPLLSHRMFWSQNSESLFLIPPSPFAHLLKCVSNILTSHSFFSHRCRPNCYFLALALFLYVWKLEIWNIYKECVLKIAPCFLGMISALANVVPASSHILKIFQYSGLKTPWTIDCAQYCQVSNVFLSQSLAYYIPLSEKLLCHCHRHLYGQQMSSGIWLLGKSLSFCLFFVCFKILKNFLIILMVIICKHVCVCVCYFL